MIPRPDRDRFFRIGALLRGQRREFCGLRRPRTVLPLLCTGPNRTSARTTVRPTV